MLVCNQCGKQIYAWECHEDPNFKITEPLDPYITHRPVPVVCSKCFYEYYDKMKKEDNNGN